MKEKVVVPVLGNLRGRLIVSCQASVESPFADAALMTAMARAVLLGGAAALRIESVAHVQAMRLLEAPVVGLIKRRTPGSDVYITPTVADVEALVDAGAAIIATDGTARVRPGGEILADLVTAAHALGVPVMADIDGVPAAEHALAAGADILGTTLSGYTAGGVPEGPDLRLVAELVARFDAPVFAEGRYSTPEQVGEAIARGAWSVVVGTAISDPVRSTARFRSAVEHQGGRR
jgi:N-acylglucosamine-6-phosphate 2-epimerase